MPKAISFVLAKISSFFLFLYANDMAPKSRNLKILIFIDHLPTLLVNVVKKLTTYVIYSFTGP